MSRLPAYCLAALLLAAPLFPRAAAAQQDRLSGVTLGVFIGIAVLDSTVDIPATPNGPAMRFVDQGGDGMIFGARLGYGRLLGNEIYLGAEIEGLLPLGVTSRLNAAGAEYRARLRQEVGIYGRVGWSPDGRSMVYLRGGLTVPRQLFETASGSSARWQPGPAIGAGAEVAVTENLLIRLDATWDLPAGHNSLESYRMSAGLVWRF